MKTLLLILSVSVTCLCAREIVPGIVSFDEPTGFHGFGPHHDPGDSPFILSRTIIQYQPDGNSSRSFRQFDIGIGVVGYDVGAGKRITFRSLSEEELKKELIGGQNDGRIAVSLAEVVVSEHKAFRISWHHSAQALRPDGMLYVESYYVPFEANRGVSFRLTADSEEGVLALRELLTRVSIPKEPREIVPPPSPPPPEPTAEQKKKEQIVSNLRIITSAADQFLLEHGVTRVMVSELKRQKNLWVSDQLANLTSIDGETYDDLVFEQGKGLRVRTRALGDIVYAP